jgi:hypothetical protein
LKVAGLGVASREPFVQPTAHSTEAAGFFSRSDADQILNRSRAANHLFTIDLNMHNVPEKFGPLARHDSQFRGNGGRGMPCPCKFKVARPAQGRTYRRTI